jgi:hypothetical protein
MKGKATDISAYFTSHTPFPRRTSSTTSVVEVVKMSLAKARIEKGQLFSLPTDLLPFIFSFLSSKELCCLDSSILNHTDRPIFLSALIQRFTKKSNFVESSLGHIPRKSKAHWYLRRRIPITSLDCQYIPCSKGMISTNINYLTDVSISGGILEDEDALALGNCLNLKSLALQRSSPNLHISSILPNLSNLESLELSGITLSRTNIEIISGCCQSLKTLNLSSLVGVGDEELRILVEGFPILRSLRLCYLDITEESVRMLRNHRPQIPSIGISGCEGVSVESVLVLLGDVTIPTILDEAGGFELQDSAFFNFCISIESFVDEESDQMRSFISRNSLLERLISHVSAGKGPKDSALAVLEAICSRGCDRQLVGAGVVPLLVRLFNSFDDSEKSYSLMILLDLSNFPQHFFTSGVLSLFRPHLIRPMHVSED